MMKRKIKYVFSLFGLFLLVFLNSLGVNAAQTECDRYTVCPIYNKKTKQLKIYGENNVGQLGVSRNKDYYYKEEAILVNDLLPKKEKIISYLNLKDNMFVVTESNKVYVAGENNLGQIGKATIKNKDKFQLVSYLSKYKVKRVEAEWDDDFNYETLTYIIKEYSSYEDEYITLDKNKKFIYVHDNSYNKNQRDHSYTHHYNINNNFLYKRHESILLKTDPPYKGKQNKITYKKVFVSRDKSTKKLLKKKIYKSFTNTRGTDNIMKWNGVDVTTYEYTAKYNKKNKLKYRNIVKKNSNNRVTYKSYYKAADGKIIKKVVKNKYYNNTNMYGNKNIKQKSVYTFNKAGQLKSNKHGKAYKAVTKYDKNGKKISKTTYKYNAKGIAKVIKK